MTGNFKEFKVDSHATGTWDEQNVMTSTAVCISLWWENFDGSFEWFEWNLPSIYVTQDYIASIDSAAQTGLDIK